MTDTTEPVIVFWSGGKDSAICLATLRADPDVEVAGLLTTIQQTDRTVPMHGVDDSLIVAQADRLDLPVRIVELPEMPSNDVYERRVGEALRDLKEEGVATVAFGDLFLEDVRQFRESQIEAAGMDSMFPIWGRSTEQLARQFVDDGWQAVVTCVDTDQLEARFVGRMFDHELLDELPDGVDPCAEHGEFHTFVFDGPLFSSPVDIESDGPEDDDGRFRYLDVALAGD